MNQICTVCKCTQKVSLPEPVPATGILGTFQNCSNDFFRSLLEELTVQEPQLRGQIPKERSDSEPEPKAGLLFVVERDDEAKGGVRYREKWDRSQRDGEFGAFKRSYCKAKSGFPQKWRRERYYSTDSNLSTLALVYICEDEDRRLKKHKCDCQKLFKTIKNKRKQSEQLDRIAKEPRIEVAQSPAAIPLVDNSSPPSQAPSDILFPEDTPSSAEFDPDSFFSSFEAPCALGCNSGSDLF